MESDPPLFNDERVFSTFAGGFGQWHTPGDIIKSRGACHGNTVQWPREFARS